jgi:hypothetical protein
LSVLSVLLPRNIRVPRNGAGLGAGLVVFPAGPDHVQPGAGHDAHRIGVAAGGRLLEDAGDARRLAFWGVGGDVADRVAELIVRHISTPRAGGAEHFHVSADTTCMEVESQLVEDLEDRWPVGANGGVDDHECR